MLNSKYKKFIIFYLVSSVFYLDLFLVEPIRRIVNDSGTTLRDNNLFYFVIISLLINLLIYLYFFRQDGWQELSFKKVFFCYLGLNIALAIMWPVSSTDIFSYIYQGRILAIYHSNPYLATYQQFPSDAFYHLVANMWESKAAPYGPLFIIISGLLTWLGKINLFFSLYLFKAIFVGANLLTAYLVYKISNLKTFYLYAFNPLVIFEFVINGHNDVLVLLGWVLSIYFLSKQPTLKNYILAVFFLVLSTLIKLTTIIFWPILVLFIFKNIKDKRSRWIFTTTTFFVIALTILIIYAPFLDAWQTLYLPIMSQVQLSGFYSLGVYFIKIFSSLSGFTPDLGLSAVVNKIIFLVFYLVILIKIIFANKFILKDSVVRYQTLILVILFLTSFTWLMPWYFTLLIFAGSLAYDLEKKKIYFNLVSLFTFYGIVYYLFLR